MRQALADPDANVRRAAAGALGQLGAAAATPEVLATLLQALADPDATCAGWLPSAGAAGRGGGDPEVLALLHTLADPDADVRRAAAGRWGSWARQRRRPRCDGLAPPWPIRTQTYAGGCRALGQLGAAAATPEVLTALLHTLADPDANVPGGCLERWGSWARRRRRPCDGLAPPGRSGRRRARAAASGLQRLSGYVRLPDRSAMVKLLLPLARSNDAEYRDVGYVSLRNLLATEPVSDMSHALAGLSE